MERLPHGAHLLRGGDLGCARLLVLLRQEAQHLPGGSVVHLETSDPIAPIDLPAWCRITGHGYLGPVEDEGTPRYGVRVCDTAHATDPAFPWRVQRD
ncbi:sulfurtransferase TusA family protein [Janibacter alittae]|uniref:Sulfurtransferase TusA family protein n=1 Tax=Janibacter alittae TaxID=3115209 RepID=A0ABZ2MKU4_9MICO